MTLFCKIHSDAIKDNITYLTKIGINLVQDTKYSQLLYVKTVNRIPSLQEIEDNATMSDCGDPGEVDYVIKAISELGITIIVSAEDSVAIGEEEVYFIPQCNILAISY